ncbi:restriction endonuclease [Methyloglobulus sp.]|uniref:restriction endonuclease n=1 Tax=Methyloglobulus sp. TaxID=2518622 RepID=UPI0032B7E9D9
MKKIPTREQLLNPVLQALVELGGSGSIEEINEKIIINLQIPEELVNIPHIKNKEGGQTELEYQLAWSRTMLRSNGYITNSKRGIWALVDNSNTSVEGINLPKIQLSAYQQEDLEENWKSKLQKILIEKLTPDAFERLIQRFLREKGFSQVEVTGRSGDGGVDGKGIAKINGILSFHIVFQCKKYQGAVSAGHIRDFRGAMVGRTDKGLFITTGYFTRDAIKEATRDGTPTIDLIDGEKLVEKLKELNLGVNVELIEKISIDEKWFEGI